MNDSIIDVKERTILLDNLDRCQFIRIDSIGSTIDFTQESVLVEVYFDDETEPTFYEYSDLHIEMPEQHIKTSFQIPVNGCNKAKVVISNHSDFDIMQVTAQGE